MTMRMIMLGLLFLAGAASAQTVAVRSGEHGSFTRLALDMPYRAAWRIEDDTDGVRLIFSDQGSGQDLDFDTTQVFDRIDRDRLRAITPSRGQLRLDLACDCDVDVFWHTDRMLVVDIAESFPAKPTARRGAQASPPSPDRGSEVPPVSATMPELSQILALTVPQGRDALAEEKSKDTQRERAFDLSGMRKKLLGEFARAASQGLLTPSHKPQGDSVRAPRDAIPAPDVPRDVDHALLNLTAQSSIDSAITARRHKTTTQAHRADCLPAAWVDLPSWGGTDPFYQQIGDLNRRLLGEFDRPDGQVALALARLYLYFGFGAEARETLDLRPDPTEKDAVLDEMAVIMDRGHAPDGARLAKMAECEEPFVLWALLAMPTLPEDLVFDHKALLRSFTALPAALRDTFGPELARRLIKARHANTAQNILRITARTGATAKSDLALARADLAAARRDPDTARTELNTAIAENSEEAPEALARLIETLLSEGAPVPLKQAELAGAYAYEHRGTDMGRRMTETYLAALGASGAFAKAVSEFERLKPDLEATAAADIASALLDEMTRHADDVTFLRHTLSHRLITPDAAPAPLGVQVATRLLASGLADQAGAFVAADLPGRSAPMSKLTRAKIALTQDRPRQAEVELLGLDGADVNALRAKARSLMGEHAAAQRLYTASEQPEKATEEAWLASDFDYLAEANDPLLRKTAKLLQDGPEQPQGGDAPVLERDRGLLESAAILRAALQGLLAAKAAPEAPQG